MNRIIFISFIIFTLMIGCKNKTESKTTLKRTEIKDLNHKEKYTNNSNDSFFIKLNTVYAENGLEDYSKDSKEVYGEIVKQLKGTDGSEYYLLKLNKTLEYKELNQNIPLKTDYLIIGGRFKQQPLRRGATKTVVNVAIVKDETLVFDKLLDFSKAIFAGFGEATEVKK